MKQVVSHWLENIFIKLRESKQIRLNSAYNCRHLCVRVLRIFILYRGVLRGPIYLHDEPCVEDGSA